MHLHHVAVGARDVEALARFYGSVFELAELRRHQFEDGSLRSIWLDAGGTVIMVERCETPAPLEACHTGPFLIAFAVTSERRAKLEAALEANGAPIESRTEWSSYARDPEGNRVAISHYVVTSRT